MPNIMPQQYGCTVYRSDTTNQANGCEGILVMKINDNQKLLVFYHNVPGLQCPQYGIQVVKTAMQINKNTPNQWLEGNWPLWSIGPNNSINNIDIGFGFKAIITKMQVNLPKKAILDFILAPETLPCPPNA